MSNMEIRRQKEHGKSVRMCRALVMQRFVDDVQRDMTRREQRTKAALDAAGAPKSKLLDRCLFWSILRQIVIGLHALPCSAVECITGEGNQR